MRHSLKMTLYNSLNLFFYYLTGRYYKNLNLIKKLKDKHKGQRCFIICNGPSLSANDLTKIHEHGDISIGINLIGRIYKNTPWRATYLSLTDDIIFASKENKMISEQSHGEIKFYHNKRFFKSLKSQGEKLYLSFDESYQLLDNPKFDSNITHSIPSIGTSAYACIELAVYLGCNEIYIIGCDLSYKVNLNRDGTVTFNDDGKDHFYKNEEEAIASCKTKPYPTWQMQVAFDAAAKFSIEQGYIIRNATRGGKLESFPRVDFDSLFND